MELTPAQRDALTTALHGARADVRERLTQYVATMWETLGSWRDDDITRFVAAVAPRIEAGKTTLAKLTDAYIAAMIDDAPAGVTNLAGIRGGVTPADSYRRPAVAMRTALAQGRSFSDALAAGGVRLKSIVETDLQLAHTHQARASMTGRRRRGRGNVEAFSRVPSGRDTCALCLIAATQRYWVRDLLPIHPGCSCGVQPLGIGEHLTQVIDPDLLESVHAQVEGLTGIADRGGREVDYRKLIVTRQHGEYGPTLAWKHQRFTDTDGIGGRAPVIVSARDSEHWRQRQHALGIDTHGENLEPHEIEFVARFQALGEQMEWIPRTRFTSVGRAPTNDFTWRGLPFELKTVRADYRAIHGRILSAATRAARQNVIKENFIIDLGDQVFTEALRRELEAFNVDRRKYRLRELWVFARNGLQRIDLQ